MTKLLITLACVAFFLLSCTSNQPETKPITDSIVKIDTTKVIDTIKADSCPTTMKASGPVSPIK